MALAGALRYWHTLRYLKPVQVYGRLWFRLYRPRPQLDPAPPRRAPVHDAGPLSDWVAPARVRPSMSGPEEFRFLNLTRGLADGGWNPPGVAKLWTYNLHYFADLCAHEADQRAAWHADLLRRWVRENPPGQGVGWEPYPASLRIVNWIKWALAGNALPEECVHSLAVQARWLTHRLERHILGNHLFVNAKALVFAGLFFQGPEADRWLDTGVRILQQQIPEQILPDGGQFERSPMYHALALEDMLDLCNVVGAFAGTEHAAGAPARPPARARALVETAVRPRIEPMRRWLAAMCHPDGEISFFNDAAVGIAPAPAELDAYARRLGFPALPSPADGVTHLPDSGYIRVQRGSMVALLDVAPIGPDYLPGHAHADTLSCELSLHGRRVLVNSGTGEYGTGPERHRQRGTAAHNAVEVAGLDSSEVWGGFRVARRARPLGLKVEEEPGGQVTVTCAHDGYRSRLGAMVTRTWVFASARMTVTDTCTPAELPCRTRWHAASDVEITPPSSGEQGRYRCTLPGGATAVLTVHGKTDTLVRSTVHMEFGRSEPASVLDCTWTGKSTCTLEWQ